MESFMEAHSRWFADAATSEYGHHHHHLYTLYRGEFERQATEVLREAGITLEQLEDALAKCHATRPAVLFTSLLASVHSFPVFASMMHHWGDRKSGRRKLG